jgi:hypothetical protein
MKTIEELAQDIDYCANVYSALEMTCKGLHIRFAASPLYNFRDALSHYIKLYESQNNDEEKIVQETSITEHLFRGLKDGCFFIIFKLKIGIYYEMQKRERQEKEISRKLRKLLHQYKDLDLRIRNNTELFSKENFAPYFDNLTTLIANTKTFFNAEHIKFDFSEYKKVFVNDKDKIIPDYEVANLP